MILNFSFMALEIILWMFTMIFMACCLVSSLGGNFLRRENVGLWL